jgi:hypothetical protein
LIVYINHQQTYLWRPKSRGLRSGARSRSPNCFSASFLRIAPALHPPNDTDIFDQNNLFQYTSMAGFLVEMLVAYNNFGRWVQSQERSVLCSRHPIRLTFFFSNSIVAFHLPPFSSLPFSSLSFSPPPSFATTANAFHFAHRHPSRHTLRRCELSTFLFPWLSLWFSASPRRQSRRVARPRGVLPSICPL